MVVGNGISEPSTVSLELTDVLLEICWYNIVISLMMLSYLEDHPRTCKWLIDANNHGDCFRPLRISVFSFQMA